MVCPAMICILSRMHLLPILSFCQVQYYEHIYDKQINLFKKWQSLFFFAFFFGKKIENMIFLLSVWNLMGRRWHKWYWRSYWCPCNLWPTRQGKKVNIFIVLTILIQLIFHQNSLIYHFILSVIPSITHLQSYSFYHCSWKLIFTIC